MTPEQLIEKMADVSVSYVEDMDIRLMLRVVLQAVKDGEIVTTTEVIENGIRHNKPILNQHFKEWTRRQESGE